MATREIKTKFSLDGEKQWKQEMGAINSKMKTLKSELAASSSIYKGQANTVEALAAKNKILKESYEQQASKVKALKEALAEAEKVYADQPEKVDKYRQQLNYATVQLNKLDDELQENSKHLKEAERSQKGVTRAIDEYGNEVVDAEKKTSIFGDVLKANLASDIIIAGVKKLVDVTKNLMKEAPEAAAALAAQQSQFAQTFGSLGDEAKAAIKSVADEGKIVESRLNGTATSIYAFAKSSGADSAEALALMRDALTVTADAAAYYDKSLEDTSDTLQSFLKGNFENDAALGVSCTETTRNAAAMDLFGKKYADLSEIQKQQTLLKMVKDAQTLSGAIGQASRESDGLENVMGNWNATLELLKAKLGDPILAQTIPLIQNVTLALSDLVNGDIDPNEFVDRCTEAFEALGPGAEKAIMLLLDTIIAAAPSVLESGVNLVTSMLRGMAETTPELVPVIVDMILTILMTLLDNIDVLADGAIQLATGIITGLIRSIPAIAAQGPKIIKALINAMLSLGTSVRSAALKIGDEILNILKGLPRQALTWGKDLMDSFISGITAKITALRNKVQSIAQTVRDFIGFSEPKEGPLSNFHTYAPDMIDLFIKGLQENKGKLKDQLSATLDFSVPTPGDLHAQIGQHGTAQNTGGSYSMASLSGLAKDIQEIRALLAELKDMGIYLDGDRCVGYLIKKIDQKLGDLRCEEERGR